MKEYKVENHISSYLPDDKEWELIWGDEFDGPELDRTKWDYRLYLGGQRHKTYVENAISFDGDSNIIFHLVEKDGMYCSSTLQTGENFTDRPNGESESVKPKFMHKYGFYECRCKLQRKTPWWTAFWLQAPRIALGEDPEIAGVEVDIMESFKPNTYIPHFLHWGGYAEDHKFATSSGMTHMATEKDSITLPETEDGYHTFAVDWREDGYTFYVDGVKSGHTVTDVVSHTEQFVLLFTECKGNRDKIPGVEMTDELVMGLNDEFIVDYVRVFDSVK